MPSVNVIQALELRPQASASAPSRGGDPFSEVLESTANDRRSVNEARSKPGKRSEPSAPQPRSEARRQSLARGESPAEGNHARKSAAPRHQTEQADAAPEAKESDATGQVETELAAQQPAVAGEVETAELAADDAEANVATPVDPEAGDTESEDDGEVKVKKADTPTPDTAVADADIPANTTPDPEGTEQSAKAVAATVSAPVTPFEAKTGDDSSPVAPANVAATKGASAATADPAIKPVAEEAAPAPVREARQPQATEQQAKPQPQLQAAASAAAEAKPDDASPEPQQQRMQQTNEPKPVQAAARQADAPAPAPQADAGAPRIQINSVAPIITAEPPRALAPTLNAASLHAAKVNEPNALPLKGTELAFEIVSRMRQGMRQFDIRLDPPELGRVDVRLEVDRNGHATTRLTVDRPETLDLLQREARGLERALQQAGLKTDQGGLEFSLRQQANDGTTDGRPHAPDRPSDSAVTDDGERIEAVIEGYRFAAHARGGVDIRI